MQRSLSRSVINHAIMLAGVAFLFLPILVVFASSSHETATLVRDGLQLLPGDQAGVNYRRVLTLQAGFTDQITAADMLRNSLILGLGVGAGTTLISLLAAYAMVYFRLRYATALFWLTLATLLLPLESRFITTYLVTDALGLINTHLGMILPALAVALGTLFFRQFFLTLPEELLDDTEAACDLARETLLMLREIE